MKTRPMVVAHGDREVILLGRLFYSETNSNFRVGKQASFFSAAREKFIQRRSLNLACKIEFSDHKLSKQKSKKKCKVDDLSVTVDQQGSDSGNGPSRRIAAQSLTPQAEWYLDDDSNIDLSDYPGLVLDLTYRPINVVCWRRALYLEFLDKADVLEYYDQAVNSSSRSFSIPAVLRITDYKHLPTWKNVKLSLNRNNIFLRDRFRCQYCNAHDNLTVDHVMPASQGGSWTWDNLVTACQRCNTKKGDKTVEEANMQLIKAPGEPAELDGREMPSNFTAYRTFNDSKSLPTKWLDYLPKWPPQM